MVPWDSSRSPEQTWKGEVGDNGRAACWQRLEHVKADEGIHRRRLRRCFISRAYPRYPLFSKSRTWTTSLYDVGRELTHSADEEGDTRPPSGGVLMGMLIEKQTMGIIPEGGDRSIARRKRVAKRARIPAQSTYLVSTASDLFDPTTDWLDRSQGSNRSRDPGLCLALQLEP